LLCLPKGLLNHHKEERRKQSSRGRWRSPRRPARRCRWPLRAGAGTARKRQRHDAEAEGPASHDDGTQPQFGSFQSRFEQAHAFFHPGSWRTGRSGWRSWWSNRGWSTAQSGNRRRWASPESRAEDAADDPQGQGQQDRDGDGPAFIQGRQTKEDYQN